MRDPVNRVWQAAREYVTRLAGVRQTRPAVVVAEPALVAEVQTQPQVQMQALPSVPSIAVLPLFNVGGGADQDYFVDGIAGDIITQLSLSNTLFIVPRRRSVMFRGQTTDMQQIIRELGAGYVLGGSVRRDDEQLQINVKLVATSSGKQVWAKRFDCPITTLFEVQDAIADEVALALVPEISLAERQRIACKPIVSHQVVVGALATTQALS